jgi:phage terminase Nu1 subunit (DNA packaging protein)
MAYQAQEWTVSGLSVELKVDRRTVAKRLENVPPCRVEGVAKYYRLVDAAPAILLPDVKDRRMREGGDVLDFNEERARLTKEQADKLERERLLDEKRLVPADGVRRLIERLVGGANARLGSIPAKLAPVIRPDDPVTARRHLELAIEEVRAELRRLDVEQAGDEEAA